MNTNSKVAKGIDNTYYNHSGKIGDSTLDALNKLAPGNGPVADLFTEPNLEMYREACNCYYDFYNNGLCTHYADFKIIFPDVILRREHIIDYDNRALIDSIEDRMTEIMELAAKEQHIKVTYNHP